MKIALINASPKANSSASKILLADLKKILADCTPGAHSGKNQILEISMHNPAVSAEAFELPEAHGWAGRPTQIYGIVNCGFYEGVQAKSALGILQNWCARTRIAWGGGIGVGGGGALAQAGWRQMIRANGCKSSDLNTQL